MAAYLSNELANDSTGTTTSAPVGYRPAASVVGGRLKRIRATFPLKGQTTSDTLEIGTLPAGSTFCYGLVNATATLGASATVAIGTTGSTGKYRAAAVFTGATPTLFGVVAAEIASPLSADERVFVTIGTAALPSGSDTFVVELFYSIPN
jgi:hypothetical protein